MEVLKPIIFTVFYILKYKIVVIRFFICKDYIGNCDFLIFHTYTINFISLPIRQLFFFLLLCIIKIISKFIINNSIWVLNYIFEQKYFFFLCIDNFSKKYWPVTAIVKIYLRNKIMFTHYKYIKTKTISRHHSLNVKTLFKNIVNAFVL